MTDKTEEYEYELFFESTDDEPCRIDGWWPIATSRIRHPEQIPDLIAKGRLRKIIPVPSPKGLSAEEAATAYGESFKTGEWFETIRIEAFKEGAKWASEQHRSMAK